MIAPVVSWPMVVTGSAIGAGVITFADINSPLRPFIVLWFLAICPGMAIVRLIGIDDPIAALSLSVALSLALETLIVLTMLYTGLWSPDHSLAVVIGVTLAATAFQTQARRREDQSRVKKDARDSRPEQHDERERHPGGTRG